MLAENELRELLTAYKVPLEAWGVGRARSVKDLIDELSGFKSYLTETDDGLCRVERGLAMDVYHRDPILSLKLLESRKEKWMEPVRRREMSVTFRKRLEAEEEPLVAARRIIFTVIGWDDPEMIVPDEQFISTEMQAARRSVLYPGLWSQRVINYTSVDLPACAVLPQGYVERKGGVSTFYKWYRTNLGVL